MKSLTQIKDKVAQRMGFSNWKRFEQFVKPTPAIVDEVATEYAEQFKPQWIPVSPRTIELSEMMNNTDSRLVQCLFDTGEILAFNDDHPFAIMTHVCFLPGPPKI